MKIVVIIAGIVITIIVLIFLLSVWINAAYEEKILKVDNLDGHIICGNTNRPCIKDILYIGGNDCVGCPYENYENTE